VKLGNFALCLLLMSLFAFLLSTKFPGADFLEAWLHETHPDWGDFSELCNFSTVYKLVMTPRTLFC
jgi:hypothetical protein